MRMKTSVYIATSLDGFIARRNGDLDWLPGADGGGEGQDPDFDEFIGTVDALVMGRRTFEKVRELGDWPYPMPVVVLSSRSMAVPDTLGRAVESMSGAPAEVLEHLARRGVRHVWIDGGETIRRFLGAGLIQRLILTRVPVLIGGGVPLFGPLQEDIALRHLATRTLAGGMVQSVYQIAQPPTAS